MKQKIRSVTTTMSHFRRKVTTLPSSLLFKLWPETETKIKGVVTYNPFVMTWLRAPALNYGMYI